MARVESVMQKFCSKTRQSMDIQWQIYQVMQSKSGLIKQNYRTTGKFNAKSPNVKEREREKLQVDLRQESILQLEFKMRVLLDFHLVLSSIFLTILTKPIHISVVRNRII